MRDLCRTIVTMYALKDLDAYEVAHLTENKRFVGRNELLGKLRTDISGRYLLQCYGNVTFACHFRNTIQRFADSWIRQLFCNPSQSYSPNMDNWYGWRYHCAVFPHLGNIADYCWHHSLLLSKISSLWLRHLWSNQVSFLSYGHAITQKLKKDVTVKQKIHLYNGPGRSS